MTRESNRIQMYFLHVVLLAMLFILFFYVFFFSYYFHETGHIIFGFANNLLDGEVTSFAIGNWEHAPYLFFFKIPQQTVMVSPIINSANFMFGGPILNILIFIFISYIGYKGSGKKSWFFLAFWIFLFELFGNFLCGTDNLTGNPLSFCSSINQGLIEISIVSLFALSFAMLIYIEILNKESRRKN
jgi:hypothetical protein